MTPISAGRSATGQHRPSDLQRRCHRLSVDGSGGVLLRARAAAANGNMRHFQRPGQALGLMSGCRAGYRCVNWLGNLLCVLKDGFINAPRRGPNRRAQNADSNIRVYDASRFPFVLKSRGGKLSISRRVYESGSGPRRRIESKYGLVQRSQYMSWWDSLNSPQPSLIRDYWSLNM